jgi:hypothetical protein
MSNTWKQIRSVFEFGQLVYPVIAFFCGAASVVFTALRQDWRMPPASVVAIAIVAGFAVFTGCTCLMWLVDRAQRREREIERGRPRTSAEMEQLITTWLLRYGFGVTSTPAAGLDFGMTVSDDASSRVKVVIGKQNGHSWATVVSQLDIAPDLREMVANNRAVFEADLFSLATNLGLDILFVNKDSANGVVFQQQIVFGVDFGELDFLRIVSGVRGAILTTDRFVTRLRAYEQVGQLLAPRIAHSPPEPPR